MGLKIEEGFSALVGIVICGILVFVVYLTLTAPKEGIVEATWIEPAHWEQYQSGSVCVGYDSKGFCNMSVPIFSQRWIDTRCWMKINDTEKSKRRWTWQINCNEIPEVGKWVSV